MSNRGGEEIIWLYLGKCTGAKLRFIQASLYESILLETHYFNNNHDKAKMFHLFSLLLAMCQRGKRQLITLQVGQLSQLSSASIMTELVRAELNSCVAVGRELHDFITVLA